jgi:Domain of unknown function (DUF4918)
VILSGTVHSFINMKTFAKTILQFYQSLDPDFELPSGVEMMNPFKNEIALQLAKSFYLKFYNDNHNRSYVFGINPGRFGGGITGIPFTDPLQLKTSCGINHDLPLKAELSSDFIYRLVNASGGPARFYGKYFLTAICPLGFIQDGKNLNYYDSNELYQISRPFILKTMKEQLKSGALKETAFCLGEGTNMKYFEALNKELKLFKNIVALPHPRWIMQYRRKNVDEYIKYYQKILPCD